MALADGVVHGAALAQRHIQPIANRLGDLGHIILERRSIMSGMELPGLQAAAGLRAPLHHHDVETGARQMGGGGKTIRAGAYDRRIVMNAQNLSLTGGFRGPGQRTDIWASKKGGNLRLRP